MAKNLQVKNEDIPVYYIHNSGSGQKVFRWFFGEELKIELLEDFLKEFQHYILQD